MAAVGLQRYFWIDMNPPLPPSCFLEYNGNYFSQSVSAVRPLGAEWPLQAAVCFGVSTRGAAAGAPQLLLLTPGFLPHPVLLLLVPSRCFCALGAANADQETERRPGGATGCWDLWGSESGWVGGEGDRHSVHPGAGTGEHIDLGSTCT